jgi:hypothetical protein
MKMSAQNTAPLIVLLFLSLGCGLINKIKKEVEESQKSKVIASTDNKCQLTVPGSWSIEKDLNDAANLQAGNRFAEQYAIVISESKQDFAPKMDLNKYTGLIRKNISTSILDASITENSSITVNGYQALQFEVEGTTDDIRAKWLYTMIDAPKNYHQILAWSLVSKYSSNKPVFLDVINSFKETEGFVSTPKSLILQP